MCRQLTQQDQDGFIPSHRLSSPCTPIHPPTCKHKRTHICVHAYTNTHTLCSICPPCLLLLSHLFLPLFLNYLFIHGINTSSPAAHLATLIAIVFYLIAEYVSTVTHNVESSSDLKNNVSYSTNKDQQK